MATEIDQAFERLREIEAALAKEALQPLNESDTRFRILDRYLVEVLGWAHDAIDTENSVAEGYVDYVLTVGDRPAMVIEAKRNGRLAPATQSTRASALMLSGPVLAPFEPAIKQAANYAFHKSVPIACVTDGVCWLFFQTNRRDGTSVLDGKGVFIPTLGALKKDFPRFYDLIGPLGVSERRGIIHLNRAEGIRPPQFEEQFVVSPGSDARLLPRSDVAGDASLLFSHFFSNLSAETDLEMMRKCFVETPESKKADVELERITQKLLNGITSLETTEGAALRAEVEQALRTMRSETILIVGNKGSGKTTFLDRFFADVLPKGLREQCVVATARLERFSGDPTNVVGWTIRALIEALEKGIHGPNGPKYDDLQGIFWSDYNRWKNGEYSHLYNTNKTEFKIRFGDHMYAMRRDQPELYLKNLLHRISSAHQSLPCLIFDNADRFSDSIQDAIFQLAYSLGTEAPCLGLVPVTDRTLWRLRSLNLQKYATKSFYLPVPEAKEILAKRITFVKEKLEADREVAKSYFSSKGFRVSLSNLDQFAAAVDQIFVKNEFVSGLVGRLANFDIQEMLKLAQRVFLSPEIRIDEVLKSSFGGGRGDVYRIHRAIIKGDYDRYSEDENRYISNLFWTDPANAASPLLAFYLLWVLRQRSAGAQEDDVETRYWSVSELAAYLEAANVQTDQALACMNRLLARGLIEGLDPTAESLTIGHRVTVRESGVAHIELVLNSTVYLEQMALSTGVNSRDLFHKMRDARSVATGESFAEIRRMFIDYVLHLDKVRIALPTLPEYAGLVEARRMILALGAAPANHKEARQAPVRQVPKEFEERGKNRWGLTRRGS